MDKFILFGLEHLEAIGLGIFLIFLILMIAYFMEKKGRIIFIKFISLLILGVKIGELAYRYYYNGENYINLLPLHLCNIALILAILTTFTKSTILFQPLYFWGIGAIFAIVIPDVKEGFLSPVTISFFIIHFFIILSVVYSMAFFKFRPNKIGLVFSFLCLNLIALGVFYINNRLGTNYLYVNNLPNTSTFLDVLGAWPYYIISVELIYLILSLILYYIFREKKFKYKSFN